MNRTLAMSLYSPIRACMAVKARFKGRPSGQHDAGLYHYTANLGSVGFMLSASACLAFQYQGFEYVTQLVFDAYRTFGAGIEYHEGKIRIRDQLAVTHAIDHLTHDGVALIDMG